MNINDFTVKEITEMRMAVEMAKDMMNDIAMDPLWIKPGETKCYSSDEMKAIRKEMEENFERIMVLKSILEKLGGSVNSK